MFSIETHRRLKQQAIDTDTTLISIIASAVTEYLEKHGTDRAQLMLTMHKDD